jgi:hypothetical protein
MTNRIVRVCAFCRHEIVCLSQMREGRNPFILVGNVGRVRGKLGRDGEGARRIANGPSASRLKSESK